MKSLSQHINEGLAATNEAQKLKKSDWDMHNSESIYAKFDRYWNKAKADSRKDLALRSGIRIQDSTNLSNMWFDEVPKKFQEAIMTNNDELLSTL